MGKCSPNCRHWKGGASFIDHDGCPFKGLVFYYQSTTTKEASMWNCLFLHYPIMGGNYATTDIAYYDNVSALNALSSTLK